MNNIKLKDIPEQYLDLAEFLGIKTFISLTEFLGGSYIYIPTSKTFFNQIRNKEIKEMYEKGIDIKIISKKYNLSHNAIKKIIKKKCSPK